MPKTILVVDDYPDFANLLESRLKGEGFNARTANDGASAIETAKTLKPDLIILDIMMPHVGGTEVRIELMKDPATRGIPIIFLTGLRAPQSRQRSQQHSVRVVGKSRDFTELLGAIREEFNKAPKI